MGFIDYLMGSDPEEKGLAEKIRCRVDDNTFEIRYKFIYVDLNTIAEIKDYVCLEYDFLKQFDIGFYFNTDLMDEKITAELTIFFSKKDYHLLTQDVERINDILNEIFKLTGLDVVLNLLY